MAYQPDGLPHTGRELMANRESPGCLGQESFLLPYHPCWLLESSHGNKSLPVTLRLGKGLAAVPGEAKLLPLEWKRDALDEPLLSPLAMEDTQLEPTTQKTDCPGQP